MLITLTRSGGFTGIPVNKTVDTSTLLKDQREKIEQLLSNNPINESINKRINESTTRDQFTYTISVEDSEQVQSATFSEFQAPEEIKKLIQLLERY